MVNTAVMGATGLVGETMIQVLQDRSFPADRFIPFASKRSKGRSVVFRGRKYPVEIITPESLSKGMIIFGATSADIARNWVPMCIQAEAVVIDNSSAYRMDPGVPLIVPEVNGHLVKREQRLWANPNCSTIQLVMALRPIMELAGILWVAVSTYQAVSGAGTPALKELRRQQKGQAPSGGHPEFHGNVVTGIGETSAEGFCNEEIKLMSETGKILETDFPIYASAARVPVKTGHTESVTVKLDRRVDIQLVRQALQDAPGVTLSNSGASPLNVAGSDAVVVDRVRTSPMDPSALQFWVLADNLRKGAALNAVQIAETYLKTI